MTEQDQRITAAFAQEQGRLRNFIRRRVADETAVEDILQDVFYELVAAHRLMKPIEQVSAWLFRVARNRIIDLFRKKRPAASTNDFLDIAEDGDPLSLEDLLPSADAGPDSAYARSVLLDELDAALDAATGVSVNTLLSRKHYAVLHLRQRLQAIYDEFTKG